MAIPAALHELWADAHRGSPGHRFQAWYRRTHTARNRRHWFGRVLKIFAGLLAIAIGILEIVFPGPAFVFLLIGGGLLATESMIIARSMDWAELHVRRWWRTGRHYWGKLALPVRIALSVVAACAGAAAMWATYRFFQT